jgi:diamine N-acetyltransferase
MVLKTEEISLRPFCQDDLDMLYQWGQDKQLRFLALMHPWPVTSDNYKQWLSQLMSDTSNKNVYFAAEVNQDRKFFGYFQLREINLIHRHAFLGIIIGNPEMRGRGYGKELMKLGLDYGFNMLGLHKISLEVVESNSNAIALYNSLGFVQEGKFKDHFFFDGKWHNVVRMAIIKTH